MRPALLGPRSSIAAIACIVAASCQGGSPTTPGTLGPPSGVSTNGSISGRVTTYGAGPVSGATVLFAGVIATTDANGNFTLNAVPASGTGIVTINAPGHLFRGVAVALGANRTEIAVDTVRDADPFSLSFYRAFVRNNLESVSLRPIARWTIAPSFYVKTTVEGSGEVIPEAVMAKMREVIAGSVPELSGGRLQMAAFETGPAARQALTGWVNITFHAELGAAFGRSTVGGNSGSIDLRYGLVSTPTTNPFGCLIPEIGVLDHELTHTMGFWHTADVFADSFSGQGCPGTGRPAQTRYHAALAYSRPVGNRDPDVDPIESAQPMSARAQPPAVECVWR